MSVESSASHDSASLAQKPSIAVVDGWEIESSSADQPTTAQLEERLREDPTPPKAASDDTPTEPDDAQDSDDDETPDRETLDAPEKPSKRRLTAAERKAVLQAEFNALTRQREDARRAFEAEERERQAARAAAAHPAKVDDAAKSADAAPSEEPSWDKYEEEGKPFTQWARDHAAWVRAEAAKVATDGAEQRLLKLMAAERAKQLEDAETERADARLAKVLEQYPDLADKAKTNLADVPQTPFITTVVKRHPAGYEFYRHLVEHPVEAKVLATMDWTRPMFDVVRESDDPTPLLSYFAQHPDEQRAIGELPAPRQLLALGRLSATLSQPDAKTGSSGVTPPVTHAKPPIRPIGATRSAGSVTRDHEDLEFGPEYVRREVEAQRSRARR